MINTNTSVRLVDNPINSFPLSADVLKFCNMATGNADIYIPCRIHIDPRKVSYQNNHTADCKLVFREL